jgi:hypothetical protein
LAPTTVGSIIVTWQYSRLLYGFGQPGLAMHSPTYSQLPSLMRKGPQPALLNWPSLQITLFVYSLSPCMHLYGHDPPLSSGTRQAPMNSPFGGGGGGVSHSYHGHSFQRPSGPSLNHRMTSPSFTG